MYIEAPRPSPTRARPATRERNSSPPRLRDSSRAGPFGAGGSDARLPPFSALRLLGLSLSRKPHSQLELVFKLTPFLKVAAAPTEAVLAVLVKPEAPVNTRGGYISAGFCGERSHSETASIISRDRTRTRTNCVKWRALRAPSGRAAPHQTERLDACDQNTASIASSDAHDSDQTRARLPLGRKSNHLLCRARINTIHTVVSFLGFCAFLFADIALI